MRRPPSALWKQAPLIRMAIPFFAGIVLQHEFSFLFTILLCSMLLVLIVYFSFYFLPLKHRFDNQSIQGLLMMLLPLLLGAGLFHNNDIRHRSDWIGHESDKPVVMVFSLSEPAVEGRKTFKAAAAVEFVYENGKCKKVSGNIIIYFPKNTDKKFLHYGARMAAGTSLQPIRSTGNPGDFDYAAYAARKNIFHSMYVSSENIVLINPPGASRFMAFIHASRASIVSVFKKHLFRNSEASGLAEALVIGYKNDLDKNLLKEYTNTGVVHVIAISGMHLALIYFILEWIWKLIRIHHRKVLSGLLSIALLWVFSFLTGGSPSVLRSAIMFSFVITGRMINRKGTVFNSLTASALFLAAADPFVLWDAGFLLSHMAVLGLITLQKPLAGIFEIKNKWLRKIWEMMAVTTAAQIFTLPFCLYYFHQFPNYFLLSNLIIIPLSTIILFGGILLILVSPIPVLANATGYCLELLIRLMNSITQTIGHWPGALIENIYFGTAGLLILYVFVLLLSAWLHRKNFIYLKMTLVSLLVFFTLQSIMAFKDSRRLQFVVYNIKGHSASDVILGNRFYFWGDSLMAHDLRLQDSLLSGSRNYLKATMRCASYDMDSIQLIGVGGMKMALAGNYAEMPSNADVIIINGEKRLAADRLLKFQPEYVVFDGSCKLWKIETMRAAADSLLLHCHSVALQGAFSKDIPAGTSSL